MRLSQKRARADGLDNIPLPAVVALGVMDRHHSDATPGVGRFGFYGVGDSIVEAVAEHGGKARIRAHREQAVVEIAQLLQAKTNLTRLG